MYMISKYILFKYSHMNIEKRHYNVIVQSMERRDRLLSPIPHVAIF